MLGSVFLTTTESLNSEQLPELLNRGKCKDNINKEFKDDYRIKLVTINRDAKR